TRLRSHRIQAVAGGPVEDYSGTGTQFRYRINNSLAYRGNGFSITLRHRFLPGQPHPSSVADPQTTSVGPGDYHIFDLVGTWTPTSDRKSTRLNSSHVKIS